MADPDLPVPRGLAARLLERAALIWEGRLWAWLLLPSLVLVLAVLIYPVGSGILLSFRELRLTRPDLGTTPAQAAEEIAAGLERTLS